MGLDCHIVAIPVKEPRDPIHGHGVNIVRGRLTPDEQKFEVFYARTDWTLHSMMQAWAQRCGFVGDINNKAVRLTQAWLYEMTRNPGCPDLWFDLYHMTKQKCVVYYQGEF